jgi:hypothetical protein
VSLVIVCRYNICSNASRADLTLFQGVRVQIGVRNETGAHHGGGEGVDQVGSVGIVVDKVTGSPDHLGVIPGLFLDGKIMPRPPFLQ